MRAVGLDIGEQPHFSVERLSEDGDVRITTDLGTRLGLPPEQVHSIVERGVLGVAGLNQRIHLMQSFEAVTGFREDEAPLFERKLEYLARQLDPASQEERFDRIASIAGLPDLPKPGSGARIDIERLLDLRSDPECREFRSWLRSVDAETDREIADRFDSLRSRLAGIVESTPGKAVRFLVTNGIAFVPLAGPVVAPALDAADSFALERILGKPGPATFLSKRYPTIFNSRE